MELHLTTFLIVCPLVFLAGLIDAIGGGGGLISLPAYLFAGLPPHMAVATNKLSSACGTAVATGRMILNKLVDFKIAIPSVIAAIIGSSIGARISLMMSEKVFLYLMIVILPICAVVVLNKNMFTDESKTEGVSAAKTYLIAVIAALIVGVYDGLYGPGTGTFLIIAFTVFAKLKITAANAQTKVINLTTNVTALTVFFLHGDVLLPLGLAAAACNMVGGYLGAGLMLKNGSKIVRPSIIIVLILLLVKILTEL